MFQVYNHSLQKTEYVEKIDLNKHWKAYLVPFDSIPEEVIEINNENATTIIDDSIVSLKEEAFTVTQEVVADDIAKNAPIEKEISFPTPKRGRPKAN